LKKLEEELFKVNLDEIKNDYENRNEAEIYNKMVRSRAERILKKQREEDYRKEGIWWKWEEERQRKELEKVWRRGDKVEDEEKENNFEEIPSQDSNKSCIYDNGVLRNNNEDIFKCDEDIFNCNENCDELLCDEDEDDWN